MGNSETLSELEKLQKDLLKTASFLSSKIGDVIKGAQVFKEKKGRVNKKDATMVLMTDNSIMIKFDNPIDAKNFFEDFKAK